jgi:sugar lactone lactonase YvrE
MTSLRPFIVATLALACPLAASAQSYSFKTLAGLAPQIGTADGAGSDARFAGPFASAPDAAGNVYVVDTNSHTIRKITPAGVVSTFAGLAGQTGSADGKGAAARFNFPQAVATDGDGNVYVADYSNAAVRKITPDGTVTTLAGLAGSFGSTDGTGSSARFYSPGGIAVDTAANVYVADWNGYNIRKITPAGVVSTLAGLSRVSGSADGTGTNARFLNPAGISADASGNLFVADTGNSVIRKITPDGVVTTVAGFAGSTGTTNATGSAARFNRPFGVVPDADGNLFVADTSNHSIRRISAAGVVTTFAGVSGSRGSINATGSSARFYSPTGISIDTAGNFYVTESGNYTVRKITRAGLVTDFAGPGGNFGSADGVGSTARFNKPRALAITSAETVFVADTSNHTLRKVTPDGTVTTFTGVVDGYSYVNGSGSAVRIGYTEGLAIDSNNNLYASDSYYGAIRLITTDGTASTYAGVPSGSSGSNDGPAAAARFNTPTGLATDAGGNLYVTDSFNHTIRKISPEGIVTTLAGSPGLNGTADGNGSAARFYYPSGVAVDPDGNVYVADTNNHTVRKITPEGAVTTLAGTAGVSGNADGTGAAARFLYPYGIAIDATGNILVADTDNHAIRRITPTGVVSTIGGRAGVSGYAAGSGPAARFLSPIAIAVGKSGALYILDASANTLVRGEPEVAPVITAQPLALTVSSGSTVVLAAGATGGGLAYQWRLNGVPVTGATASTLTIPNAQSFVAGGYTVVIANGAGTVTTATASLAISTTPDSGRITNLAIRSRAGTDARTLIVGTVVGGAGTTGTKPLLMRGVGPTLAAFNVAGALADPVITLFDVTGKIAENDDWAGAFDFSSVGAFAFAGPAPKDAALYNAATARGSYSIQVSGKNGATGTALAEIYDATAPGAYTAATPRLINVSARTQVGTGGDILIAGFNIGGSTAKTILIRAAGPALAAFGVDGTLVNPKLELYRGSTLLYANDDWSGSTAISTAGSGVGAFAFSNPASKDAALLLTLPPGGYTAQVSGADGGTGVALVEIYEVP